MFVIVFNRLDLSCTIGLRVILIVDRYSTATKINHELKQQRKHLLKNLCIPRKPRVGESRFAKKMSHFPYSPQV